MCEHCSQDVIEVKGECPLCRTPFDDWIMCNGNFPIPRTLATRGNVCPRHRSVLLLLAVAIVGAKVLYAYIPRFSPLRPCSPPYP